MPIVDITKTPDIVDDKPIQINIVDGVLNSIDFAKNNRHFYCNLNPVSTGALTWGIYATDKNGNGKEPFIKSEEDIRTFFNELQNLPPEQIEEYSDIITQLKSQFELCQKYFMNQATKEEINAKNYIIENHNKPTNELDNSIQSRTRYY